MKKTSVRIRKLCIAAMLLALGWLLPFLTGQNRELGNILCLMHIPVFMAGLALGPWYGLVLGFITPLSRSLIFGMPPLYPIATCMAFELATYGLLSGILYKVLQKKTKGKKLPKLIISLVIAMLGGRIVWGVAQVLCGLFSQSPFTWNAFLTGAFITAWPGIIMHLILLPAMMMAFEKAGILHIETEKNYV